MVLLLYIILVTIEQLLNRVSAEEEETLLLSFLAFRVLVHVCICQWRSGLWNERSGERLRNESLPVHVSKPLMVLNFMRATQTQPVCRLPLQEFIDEICCFHRPAIRDIRLLQVDLLGEDLIPDVFASLTSIWSSAKHELMSNDTKSEIVDLYAVVLSAHYFWCHVAWCSRSVVRIVRCPDAGNTHISDSDVAIAFEK